MYIMEILYLWSVTQKMGTVILIFQPAEEVGPGAKRMIEDGAVDKVEAIFAMHVSSEFTTSVVAHKPGPFLAGSCFFKAAVTGKGGHAAGPHLAVDPILAASASTIRLQQLVSREADPLDSQLSQHDQPPVLRVEGINDMHGDDR